MLRISQTQLDQLETQRLDSFVSRVSAFLKSQFTDYNSVPEVKMKAAVKRLVARSLTYGLETEQEIVVFVLATHYLGSNFDTQISEANNSLSDPQKTSVWKVAWLEALIFQSSGSRAEYL